MKRTVIATIVGLAAATSIAAGPARADDSESLQPTETYELSQSGHAESRQDAHTAAMRQVDALRQGLDRLRAALEQAERERDQAQPALQRCQQELEACEEKLSKTFLAIVIQWPTSNHDVDLHIIDPTGSEFYYSAKTIPGRPGELSADTVSGPGVEIWEVPVAPPGEYRVLYNFFDRHGNSEAARVKGGVYHRDGHQSFRDRTLTREGRANAMLVAVVTVNDDGSVDIDER